MPQPSRATKAAKSESIGQVETDKVDMMSSLERLLDDKLLDLKRDLATKDCINELKLLIVKQRKRIDELESKVVVMENLIEKLQERCDDNEQYQRRLCLRIDGVELPEDNDGESGDFFVVLYRSPSQDQAEFDNFMNNFELMLSKISAEDPQAVIITGDFNCRSPQ